MSWLWTIKEFFNSFKPKHYKHHLMERSPLETCSLLGIFLLFVSIIIWLVVVYQIFSVGNAYLSLFSAFEFQDGNLLTTTLAREYQKQYYESESEEESDQEDDEDQGKRRPKFQNTLPKWILDFVHDDVYQINEDVDYFGDQKGAYEAKEEFKISFDELFARLSINRPTPWSILFTSINADEQEHLVIFEKDERLNELKPQQIMEGPVIFLTEKSFLIRKPWWESNVVMESLRSRSPKIDPDLPVTLQDFYYITDLKTILYHPEVKYHKTGSADDSSEFLATSLSYLIPILAPNSTQKNATTKNDDQEEPKKSGGHNKNPENDNENPFAFHVSKKDIEEILGTARRWVRIMLVILSLAVFVMIAISIFVYSYWKIFMVSVGAYILSKLFPSTRNIPFSRILQFNTLLKIPIFCFQIWAPKTVPIDGIHFLLGLYFIRSGWINGRNQ